MADIYSFEEGAVPQNKEVILDSRQALDTILRQFSLHTEVEERINDVIVRVQEFAGGSEYLAKGMDDMWLLKDLAHRVEKRGSFTLYYIKLDGRKVTRP